MSIDEVKAAIERVNALKEEKRRKEQDASERRRGSYLKLRKKFDSLPKNPEAKQKHRWVYASIDKKPFQKFKNGAELSEYVGLCHGSSRVAIICRCNAVIVEKGIEHVYELGKTKNNFNGTFYHCRCAVCFHSDFYEKNKDEINEMCNLKTI